MADINDPTQNVTLWNNAKGKNVGVITDGSIERLAVDANVTGGVSLQRFAPKFAYAVPNISLTNGVDTSVFSFTGDAQIDFFQILCKNASYETILKINGTEELRITQSDLSAIGLLSSNSTSIPVYGASANKIFTMQPFDPLDAPTSFEILIKATAAGNELDGWFVKYRELS